MPFRDYRSLINIDCELAMHIATSGANPLPPARMSADERIGEIARILAESLVRRLPEQSRSLSAELRDSSFDILALRRRVGRSKLRNRDGVN